MKFQHFIMQRRQKLGLSKKGLALEAGISDVYVKRIEEGGCIPKNTFIIYKLADALRVNRDWLHDYAYFNRDPETASQYLNKEAILEGENTEGQYYNTCLGRNHLNHLTGDLASKRLMELFERLTEDQKASLLKFLQANCKGLIFNEKFFGPQDRLYQVLEELTKLEDGIIKRVLDYVEAIIRIEINP